MPSWASARPSPAAASRNCALRAYHFTVNSNPTACLGSLSFARSVRVPSSFRLTSCASGARRARRRRSASARPQPIGNNRSCRAPPRAAAGALLAAHVNFVDLDCPRERFLLAGTPCGSDPVRQMPRGLLRDPQVAVQLHAADALHGLRHVAGRWLRGVAEKRSAVGSTRQSSRVDAESILRLVIRPSFRYFRRLNLRT